ILSGKLSVFVGPANAGVPPESAKSLPDKIGVFRARGPAFVPTLAPHDEERLSYAFRTYAAPSGKTYVVDISKTLSDSAAYTLLTSARGFYGEIKLGIVGTASIVAPRGVSFCKGSN